MVSCNEIKTSPVSEMQDKICGTWETYSSTIYDKNSHEVTSPESPFEPQLIWQLIISPDGTITKPAEDEYSEEEKTTYKLYMSNEALEKELIRKAHQRRCAGYVKDGEDNMVLLITEDELVGEKRFQIVSCTEDTLVVRYLSESTFFDDILENKFVRKN
ncbi:MAG: hypothetical protein J5486_05600 [Bacteroidaceae bacterium]|nr:hypothetical protein [Bacteroidaceae bacterium]